MSNQKLTILPTDIFTPICRETGLSQGVSLKVGLNDNITTYLKFAYLVVNCNCGCSKSNIKLCRHNPTSQV